MLSILGDSYKLNRLINMPKVNLKYVVIVMMRKISGSWDASGVSEAFQCHNNLTKMTLARA